MSTDHSDLHLDQQLCFAVYATAHAFTRFYKPMLAALGLTYPQYLVMLALWETDSQSVTAIGDKLLLDSGTLTPVLKRLEALGFVSRRRSSSDERQLVVTLTSAGRSAQAIAATFPGRILNAATCSAEDLGTLRRTLFTLRRDLDAATLPEAQPSL